MYDIIIIGAGPAGITSAIYAKRLGVNVLVLYSGESNLEKTDKIENYYGFVNGIEGKTLYQIGIDQAKELGIDLKNEEVLNIEKTDMFIIKTDNDEYIGKSVIIATGNKKIKPNIKGISEFEGKGISYCAICDGFFYKNKKVAVIGNGKFAVKEADELRDLANDIKILTNGLEMKADSQYEVNTNKITQICGEGKVEEIEFQDGTKLQIDGIFIAVGEAGGSDFAKRIGIMLDNNSIIVDENMQTNVKGLYACGDITGGLLQISKAVYEGAKAGIAAAKYIKEKGN